MNEEERKTTLAPEPAETAQSVAAAAPVKKDYRVRHVIMKNAADIFTPTALVFGLYVILHGTVSPGGGFQGGVLVASAVLLIYLGYGYKTASKAFNLELLHKCEAVAAILYICIALLGILYGTSFAENVLYDVFPAGSIFSAGTITFMNYAVGFKVLTGIGFLMLMMLSLLDPADEEEIEEVLDE